MKWTLKRSSHLIEVNWKAEKKRVELLEVCHDVILEMFSITRIRHSTKLINILAW